MTGCRRPRPAALMLLAPLAVLAGLMQQCSGVREGSSVETPKLQKLQEEQAKRDAEWKPVRDLRC